MMSPYSLIPNHYSLYRAMYKPNAVYNDRVLCIPQSSDKNGSGFYTDNIDSLNEALMQQQILLSKLNPENSIQLQQEKSQTNKLSKIESEMNVALYPNPTKDVLYIAYNSQESGTLYLYNMVGQEILKTDLSEKINVAMINIPNISSGMYNCKIVFGDKRFDSKISIIK